MYEYRHKDRSYGDFGWLVEVIAGAVEGASLGAAWAVKHDALKKEQRKLKRAERSKYNIISKAKEEELKTKERLLGVKSKTELYKDTTVKKLVKIGGLTAVAITTLIILVIYLGARDE